MRSIYNKSLIQVFLLINFLFFCKEINSQELVSDDTITVEQAIENILLGGGVDVFNITLNGSAVDAQSPASSVMGFSDINNTGYPFSDGFHFTTLSSPDILDQDLQALTSNTLNNGVIIEFDLVPIGNKLKFNYIFASEEYEDFTCSNFNDVFGFFLSGPGINGPFTNGAKNIATVPWSNDVPVAINTINSGEATGSGQVSNCFDADPNWENNTIYFTEDYNVIYNASFNDIPNPGGPPFPPAQPGVNYNGSTVQLTAQSDVQCYETYHIKLAVGNVGDDAFDSGVLLQAESFTSYPIDIRIGDSYDFVEEVFYRDCIDFTSNLINLTRVSCDNSDSLVIRYETSGTAIEGVDYEITPDSIVFAPNQETTNSLNLIPAPTGAGNDPVYVDLIVYYLDEGDTVSSEARLWIYSPPPLETEASFVQTSCPTDVSYAVTPNGVYPYEYSWSTGVTDSIGYITLSDDGVYSFPVTVTDACNRVAEDTAYIELNQAFQVELNAQQPTGCNDATGVVSVSVDGANGIVDYSWTGPNNTSSTDATWTGVEPGWYFANVSVDGCTITDSILVPFQNDSLAFEIASDTLIYRGCNEGILDLRRYSCDFSEEKIVFLEVSGTAIEGDDYESLPDTLVFEANEQSSSTSIVPLSPGSGVDSVTVNVRIWQVTPLGDTVETEQNFWIVNPPELQTSASSVEVNCFLDSIPYSVEAQGYEPFEYNWQTGVEDSVGYVTIDENGTYTYPVTVTDACGQVVEDTATIIVNKTLSVASISTTPAGCFWNTNSGSVSVEIEGATGAIDYSWSGPGNNSPNTQDSSYWEGLDEGWYFITASDSICSVSDSVFVDYVSDSLSINPTQDTTILRACTEGGVEFKRYSCDLSEELSVYIVTTGTAIEGVDYDTFPDSISFDINEDNSILDIIIFPEGSGVDSVYIDVEIYYVDNQGDTVRSQERIWIIDPPIFETETSSVNLFCAADSIQYSVDAEGYDPFEYSWDTGVLDSIGYTSVSGNGTYSFVVTVTDGCGRVIEDTATVSLNQTLAITGVSETASECDVSSGSVSVEIEGTTGDVDYTWSGPGVNSPNIQDSSSWTGIGPGWYYVTVTDSVCSVSDSVLVSYISDSIELSLGTTTTDTVIYRDCTEGLITINRYSCDFANDFTVFVNSSGTAEEGVDYETLPGTISFGSGEEMTSSTITTLPNGTDTVYVDVEVYYVNHIGDTIRAEERIWIVNPPSFEVTASTDTIVCTLDTAMYSVSASGYAPFTYSWDSGVEDSIGYTNLSDNGTYPYVVSITDGCGRMLLDTAYVVLNQTLVVESVFSTATECGGETGSVVAIVDGTTGGLSTIWSGPGLNSSFSQDSTSWTGVGTGWYYFTVTDSVCSASDSVFVNEENAPLANFIATPVTGNIPLEVDFENTSEDASIFDWYFGNGSEEIETDGSDQSSLYTEEGEYEVTLIAYGGNCLDTAVLVINATDFTPAIYDLPNIFTPNGDGVNDFFTINAEKTTALEMVILNRWGNVVFESNEIDAKWNGLDKNDGNPVSEGTYFYKIRITGKDSVSVEEHGSLQLVRQNK